MAVKGKRVIFAGPLDETEVKPLAVEGICESSFLPGSVVDLSATGLETSTTLATDFGELFLIANKNVLQSRTVDDAWVVGENAMAFQPRSGEFYNVLMPSGQALTKRGIGLARNGTGQLRIAAVDGTEEVIAYSDEIVTTTAVQLVRVRFA